MYLINAHAAHASSNNIITRLDKSLQLVNEAKSAKIAKMRHEQRLKELRHEMEQTQRKLKEEQVKITRIHPQICASNELISKLKQKRAKVLEMAVKLGKSVKGDDYRYFNSSFRMLIFKLPYRSYYIQYLCNILT